MEIIDIYAVHVEPISLTLAWTWKIFNDVFMFLFLANSHNLRNPSWDPRTPSITQAARPGKYAGGTSSSTPAARLLQASVSRWRSQQQESSNEDRHINQGEQHQPKLVNRDGLHSRNSDTNHNRVRTHSADDRSPNQLRAVRRTDQYQGLSAQEMERPMKLYLHKCGCVSFRPRRSRSHPTVVRFMRLFSCAESNYTLEEGLTPTAIHEAKRLSTTQAETFMAGYAEQLKRKAA